MWKRTYWIDHLPPWARKSAGGAMILAFGACVGSLVGFWVGADWSDIKTGVLFGVAIIAIPVALCLG